MTHQVATAVVTAEATPAKRAVIGGPTPASASYRIPVRLLQTVVVGPPITWLAEQWKGKTAK
jgi:hypothetical protein